MRMRRGLFSQTLIDFEAGGIPMQDRNGVMPIFSYSNAQFARAPDHLCCYLAERCAEFIDGCVFASPIKRPIAQYAAPRSDRRLPVGAC